MLTIIDYIFNEKVQPHDYDLDYGYDKKTILLYTDDYNVASCIIEKPSSYVELERGKLRFIPIQLFDKNKKFVIIISCSDYAYNKYLKLLQFEGIVGVLIIDDKDDMYYKRTDAYIRRISKSLL